MIERLNEDVPGDLEPAAQIVPERNAKFVTGLGEAKKRITAIAAGITACSGAHLAPGHVATDVVLKESLIGVGDDEEERLGLFGHYGRPRAFFQAAAKPGATS